MSLPPSGEIPQGAIRFNTDSQRLEFYAQGEWWVMSTDTPNLGRSVDTTPGPRGIFPGGITPSAKNEIDYINISSLGDAIDFGNLTESRGGGGGAGDRSRGLLMGGYSVPGYTDTIDFWTFASTGDATDFGNLSTAGRGFCQATSNSTRAINGGGWSPTSDVMDYVTIQSTGNAVDFGNLSVAREVDVAAGSSTRGIWAGGLSPGSPYTYHNVIEYVTIATLGNAQDFGDLATASWGGSGSGNATRMIIFGGQAVSSPASYDGTISSITIASGGNAVRFGEPIDTTSQGRGGCSSPTRSLSGGGDSPTTDVIEYVEIATEGNSVDFGDLTVARHYPSGCSNAHGGL